MFSALKKLTQKNAEPAKQNVEGLKVMPSALQKTFSRGIQYNMKIIIKGDRNVGKSCLFQRLQGGKFVEAYTPTDEIQVTSIQWTHNNVNDVIKVEIWDVVDKGKKKKKIEGLKLENVNFDSSDDVSLDAEFLDVYKGTNGVILMLDLTKMWTFDYVQREMEKIPLHIPVIVLANFCDMSHHRTVTKEHLIYFVENANRERDSKVVYCESSMRNGFGLKILHKFFSLPFLQLQKETLLGQLKKNENETRTTINEMESYIESEEADYDKFLEKLTSRRREIAVQNSNLPPTRSDVVVINTQHTIHEITNKKIEDVINKKIDVVTNKKNDGLMVANKNKTVENVSKGIIAANKGNVESREKNKNNLVNINNKQVSSVDDFCPDENQLDKSFLEEETNSYGNNQKAAAGSVEEGEEVDGEIDNCNPLVANFQDYADSDDDFKLIKPKIDLKSEETAKENEVFERKEDGASFYEDSKWRMAPEGEEEAPKKPTDAVNSKILVDNKKEKEEEQSSDEKEKEKKKSSKDRDKKHKDKDRKKKKKSKQKTERDELEDFLNETSSEPKVQLAYEAI